MIEFCSTSQKEGWFKEYEGADPGYQTLCTYYLNDVHQLRPDLGLFEPLRRSILFLWHFAHPDGSFGGLYGSRCTRFYYPGGIDALSAEVPEAEALASYMYESITKHRVVTLSSMDEPNLIPMFNAYTLAATLKDKNKNKKISQYVPKLPFELSDPFRLNFPEAGLLIDRGPNYYTVISLHKGGVVYHFCDGQAKLIDAGVIVRDSKGRFGSSQSFNPANNVNYQGDELEVISTVSLMPKQLPNPIQYVILRLLSLTAFRFVWSREWIKRCLVNLLITRRINWPVCNIRYISLGSSLKINDRLKLTSGYQKVNGVNKFVPIHMASQGYWQVQDEEMIMIPRFKPFLGWSELFALFKFNKGSVEKFEKAFAKKFKAVDALSFPYGRSAQWAFLRRLISIMVKLLCLLIPAQWWLMLFL